MQVTEKELRSLPKEPSSDPISEVIRVLSGFHEDLSKRLDGTPEECGLIQIIRLRTERFKCEIRDTAPEFVPWKHDETPRHVLPVMEFLANEETVGKDSSNDDGNDANNDNHASKKRKRDSVSSYTIYIDDVMEDAQRLVLDWSHQPHFVNYLSSSRTRELPDNYPFIVQKNYICEILQAWKEPAFDLFDEVYHILKEDVAKMVDQHFSQMGRGGAKQSVLYDAVTTFYLLLME